MPDHNHVVVTRDDRLWIVGPFPDSAAITAWAEHHAESEDDPRWQTIYLPDGQELTVPMVPPSLGAAWSEPSDRESVVSA